MKRLHLQLALFVALLRWSGLLSLFAAFQLVTAGDYSEAISINLSATHTGRETYIQDTKKPIAGVIPVGNWNELPWTWFASESSQGVALLPLKNSLGGTVEGFTFSMAGYTACFNSANFGTGRDGDTALMKGGKYSTARKMEMTFNGQAPYETFDLYLYYNAGNVNNSQLFSICSSDGNVITSISPQYAKEIPGDDSQFILSNGSNNANYVKFSGLTRSTVGANFIIRASTTAGYVYLNGIQLVNRGGTVWKGRSSDDSTGLKITQSPSGTYIVTGIYHSGTTPHSVAYYLEKGGEKVAGNFYSDFEFEWNQPGPESMGMASIQIIGSGGTILAQAGFHDVWGYSLGGASGGIRNPTFDDAAKINESDVMTTAQKGGGRFLIDRVGNHCRIRFVDRDRPRNELILNEGLTLTEDIAALRIAFVFHDYPGSSFGSFTIKKTEILSGERPQIVNEFDPTIDRDRSDSIGVNFTATHTGDETYIKDQERAVAGVVPAGNWNDLPWSWFYAEENQGFSRAPLNNSFGTPIPGFTLSMKGYNAFLNGTDFGSYASGDTALMTGGKYSTARELDAVFNGSVPYENFDLYLYYNVGNVNNRQTFSICHSDGTPIPGITPQTAMELPGNDSSYVLSTGTNNANYVKFSGLTRATLGSNFIIRASTPAGYVYLNGIQFVNRGAGTWKGVPNNQCTGINLTQSPQGEMTVLGLDHKNTTPQSVDYVLEKTVGNFSGNFSAMLELEWDQQDTAAMGMARLQVIGTSGQVIAQCGFYDVWTDEIGGACGGINNPLSRRDAGINEVDVMPLPIHGVGRMTIRRVGNFCRVSAINLNHPETEITLAESNCLQEAVSSIRLAFTFHDYVGTHFGKFTVKKAEIEPIDQAVPILGFNSPIHSSDIQSIGINLTATHTGGETYISDQNPPIAGVVPAKNWNNMPWNWFLDDASQGFTNAPLINSRGETVNGFTATMQGYTAFLRGADFGPSQAGDTALMSGGKYSTSRLMDLRFSGTIPYENFDLYIYYHVGDVANSQVFSLCRADGTPVSGVVPQIANESPGKDNAYQLSNGSNNANYVKFSGLNRTTVGVNFIIRASTPAGYVYMNAIQFVNAETFWKGSTLDDSTALLSVKTTTGELEINGIQHSNPNPHSAVCYLERETQNLSGDFTATMDLGWNQQGPLGLGMIMLQVIGTSGNVLAQSGFYDVWDGMGGAAFSTNDNPINEALVTTLPDQGSGEFKIKRTGSQYSISLLHDAKSELLLDAAGSQENIAKLRLVITHHDLPGAHFGSFRLKRVKITPASAEKKWSIGKPPIFYWTVKWRGLSEAQAKQMADGKANVVSVKSLWDLDTIQKHGLRGIAFPNGEQYLHDREKLPIFDSFIESLREHPAFYGYYLWDEPGQSLFDGLAEIRQYLALKDPEHFSYVNMIPEVVGNAGLGFDGDLGQAWTKFLDLFCQKFKPELFSYDYYPFWFFGEPSTYFLDQALFRASALKTGSYSMNVIQSCSYNPNAKIPNENELRWQIYCSLAYGSQGLSYYTYSEPGHNGQLVDFNTGALNPTYFSAQKLNPEFIAIASELQALKSLAVYHVGTIPQGATILPSNAEFRIDPVETNTALPPPEYSFTWNPPTKGFAFGYFGTNNVTSHVLVVNLDYNNPARKTIIGVNKIDWFNPLTGTWTPCQSNQGTFDFPPGGGILVRTSR